MFSRDTTVSDGVHFWGVCQVATQIRDAGNQAMAQHLCKAYAQCCIYDLCVKPLVNGKKGRSLEGVERVLSTFKLL